MTQPDFKFVFPLLQAEYCAKAQTLLADAKTIFQGPKQGLTFNPNCTGLFCAMKILGGGGGLGGPLQMSAPKGPIAAKYGTHLRNCAKRKTLALFFSKIAHFISYDNLCKLYAYIIFFLITS